MKALFTILMILFSLGLLAAIVLYDDIPKGYQDETVIPLPGQMRNIQDSYGFAIDYIESSGVKAVSPRGIEARFIGKQINTRRGVINYRFTVDDGKHNYLADATVTVDMEANTVTLLSVTYAPLEKGSITKEVWRSISARALDMSEWTLTLDEAFDMIDDVLRDDYPSQAEETKTVYLYCYSDEWTFFINRKRDEEVELVTTHRISINPITKDIIEAVGFEDNVQ